jgi:hypothetical protein
MKKSNKDLKGRLRRMLQGCVREGKITVRTDSNDPSDIIELAKMRFLGRIDAAANGLGCNGGAVSSIKRNLRLLVTFTLPFDPPPSQINPRPSKKHSKPAPPTRMREVAVYVALCEDYAKVLAPLVDDDDQVASVAVRSGGPLPGGDTAAAVAVVAHQA